MQEHASEQIKGTSKISKGPEKSQEEVEAIHQQALDGEKSAQLRESNDRQADRKGAIELFLMENDLFGYEPYSPEILAELTSLLLTAEQKLNSAGVVTDITEDWDQETILRYFDRKYTRIQEKESILEKKKNTNQYLRLRTDPAP